MPHDVLTHLSAANATHKALADCGRAHIAATNGHNRRWANKHCIDALLAQNTPPGIAEQCALAMAAVAKSVLRRAEAA